jgi:murein DD-endopeptidase MepM/ murein hydrolase activator NlpD
MKYKVLLKILHGLIFIKRIFWAIGSQIFRIFSLVVLGVWKNTGYFSYKISGFFRGTGIYTNSLWFLRRDVLQIILFISLFIICIPQTKLFSKEESFIPGQQSLAYSIFGPGEQYKSGFEEVYPETSAVPEGQVSIWRTGVVGQQIVKTAESQEITIQERSIAVLKNTALKQQGILPGTVNTGIRKNIIEYKVEEGDSLGGIAYLFGISVNTLLWENGLTLRSIIKPGQGLRILPITGLTHTIKKGDTLKKIANTYKANVEEIIVFNGLDEDGSNLKIGEKIIIPNGVKQTVQATPTYTTTAGKVSGVTPPSSSQAPSTKGFVWPSAAKTITQYFSWRHHGLDVAGPKNSANYAAKAGTVEVSQCGWNSGYGCYIIINHGGGVKTLYGHNNKLLVKVGDYVSAGQTIGLMGNTGKVYGVTGIHLHFEVIVNGVRKNPLLYVR